jgi:hypothetical protein
MPSLNLRLIIQRFCNCQISCPRSERVSAERQIKSSNAVLAGRAKAIAFEPLYRMEFR